MNLKLTFYRMFFVLFIIINILLVALGLSVLWRALEDYETSLPTNIIENIAVSFEKHDFDLIIEKNNYQSKNFASSKVLERYLEDKVSSLDVDFQKQKSDNADELKYEIKTEKNNIATVVLKKSAEKTKFGFDLWQINSVDDLYIPIEKFTLTAPDYVKVMVNDVEATSDNTIVQREIIPEYEGVGESFINVYTFKDLIDTPIITATTQNAEQCTVSFNDTNKNEALIVVKPSEENFKILEALATNSAKAYARFIARDAGFDELKHYLISQSEFYKSLMYFDNRWYIEHDSYSVENIKTDNYIMYSEDYMSCDISFDYVIKKGSKTFDYKSAYTVYSAKINGKWLVANMIVK